MDILGRRKVLPFAALAFMPSSQCSVSKSEVDRQGTFPTPTSATAQPDGTCTPEQFGAVGDGKTNDQGAFEKAMTAMTSGAYGALVLGARTYLVDGALLVPPSCSIVGRGPASVLRTTSDQMIWKLRHANDVLMADMTLVGSTVGLSQNGIESGYLGGDGADRLIVSNVIARDMGGRGFSNAYGTGNSPGPTFSNCMAINCADAGFGAYSQMQLVGCTARACGKGLHMAGGNVIWTGGDLSTNLTGVYVDGGAGNNAHSIVSSTNINHCTRAIDVATGMANGMTFSAVHVYSGDLRVTSNTGLVEFSGGSVIDANTYTYSDALVRYFGGRFPMGYNNAVSSAGVNRVTYFGCVKLDGTVVTSI